MKKDNLILGSVAVTLLVIGAMTGMLVLYGNQSVLDEIITEDKIEQEKKWYDVPLGSAAAGTSGITVGLIHSHQTAPITTYGANLTGANNSYAWSGSFNASMETNASGGVPFDTNFDICIQYQFEDAHAYNATNNSWGDASEFCRAYLNSTDLSITSQRMEQCVIAKSGDADTGGGLWVAFYLQDADGGAGSGFSIGAGQTINMSEFKIQAWF